MSFPSYPKYKDSGVEWVGPMPWGWDARPLFSVAGEVNQKNTGLVEDNLLSLSYGNIVRKNIDGAEGLLPASFETYQILEKDDIVWRLTDLQNDKRSLRTGLVGERGIITSAYLGTRPHSITPVYLAYLLRAYDLTKVFYSMGGGLRQSLKFSDVKWLPTLVPPLDEQRAIATFLDRETAKIDAAIAAQERLIALLAEKRAAAISHAVTKGLDPDAPMKDSGVEWLGEVPAHWDVEKIGWQLESKPRYGVLVPDDDPGGVPMLRIRDLTAEVTSTDNLMMISQALSDQYSNTVVEVGDLVLSVVGTIGSSRVIGAELKGANLSRAIARLRPSPSVSTPFLRWIFESKPFQQYVDLTCVGTAQRVLNMDDLSALRFAFPPTPEQESIAASLREKVACIDDLIGRAEKAVLLLKERRAALISAAVTGKIDVRDYNQNIERDAA